MTPKRSIVPFTKRLQVHPARFLLEYDRPEAVKMNFIG
jgi:hypothetical protein